MPKKSYELSEVLKLVEQRELLNSKLKTINIPTVFIKDNKGIPFYKLEVSHFGDLMIYQNTKSGHVTSMLSDVSHPEDFLEGDDLGSFPNKTIVSYIQAGFRKRETKRLEESAPTIERELITLEDTEAPRRTGRIDPYASSKKSKEHWKLIFGAPLSELIGFMDTLIELFGDDLYFNEESEKASSSN